MLTGRSVETARWNQCTPVLSVFVPRGNGWTNRKDTTVDANDGFAPVPLHGSYHVLNIVWRVPDVVVNREHDAVLNHGGDLELPDVSHVHVRGTMPQCAGHRADQDFICFVDINKDAIRF